MTDVLDLAAAHAGKYLGSLSTRSLAPSAGVAELRRRIGKPLPERGMAAEAVIDELVRDAEGGILGSGSGRFFGWVIGGTLPVALAADWLTSAWDQNAASNATAPAEAVVEEVCGEWAKALLGIPSSASFAFVTGCQMAHTTALAAARSKLLADRGWDVEKSGLAGAPALRILATENRHESILRSARLLGLGAGAIGHVPTDNMGRMQMAELASALERAGDAPVIVCLQAGDLNTGAFDPFERACAISHAAKAWVHIDGAFGLWAATSERYRHLLQGADAADSWATDAHKWLNVPFDSGLVFVAHPAAHRAAFSQDTSYSIPREGLRNQKDWNPEWSRRGRAFPVYAAIRSRPLGDRRYRRSLLRPCGAAGEGYRRASGRRGGGAAHDQPGPGPVPVPGWEPRPLHGRGDQAYPSQGRRLVRRGHLARHAGDACLRVRLAYHRRRHRPDHRERARGAVRPWLSRNPQEFGFSSVAWNRRQARSCSRATPTSFARSSLPTPRSGWWPGSGGGSGIFSGSRPRIPAGSARGSALICSATSTRSTGSPSTAEARRSNGRCGGGCAGSRREAWSAIRAWPGAWACPRPFAPWPAPTHSIPSASWCPATG